MVCYEIEVPQTVVQLLSDVTNERQLHKFFVVALLPFVAVSLFLAEQRFLITAIVSSNVKKNRRMVFS